MVSFVDSIAQRLCCIKPQPYLGRSRFEDAGLLEASVAENSKHLNVVTHDLGKELLDADTRCERGEPFEQTGRDAAPLKLVRDGERNFGCVRVTQTHVTRQRDDTIVIRAEERAPFDPVGLQHRLDEALVHARMTVEPKVEALVGEAAKEVEHRIRIRDFRRTEPHGRPVAKDDVRDGLCCRIHNRRGCHSRQALPRVGIATSAWSRRPAAG